ncbi:hypothetical protein [Fodinibius sp.]|uniref:hypothetical protein n=1 Tax=Fodinibius sp. TaxID=1872440 RepID=UPI002ACD392B|nr:hypothetical protein [Fodinibius sp.]MDZ7658072.1 hypothetical protein [Fodinibius sp.]
MYDIFQRRFTPTILFENDDPGGSSTVEAKLPDDVVEGFRNLISKEGGGKDAAATLFLENKSLRDDRRELQEKLEGYQEISEDPEELKKKFNAYQELGEDPEKVKEKLEAGQEAIQKNAKYEREKQHSEVAEVQGWNPKVLSRLADEDAEFEVKTRKNDEGEDEKYGVIKTEDGEKDLEEYAKENWEDVLPALQHTGDNENDDEEKNNTKNLANQSSSSNGKSNDGGYLNKWKEENKKAAGIAEDDDK